MGRFFLALGRDAQDEKGKKWVFQAMGCLPLISGLCTKLAGVRWQREKLTWEETLQSRFDSP